MLMRNKGEVHTVFLIDGQKTDRERLPGRLWFQVLNRVKLLAKLDIANRESVQTGTLRITIGAEEFDLTVHAARESLMIELPSAKLLPAMPAEIENWWQHAAVGNSSLK